MIRPEIAEYAAAVDEATNRIAEKIQKLIDGSTGLSQEEKDLLSRQVATLQQLGKDEEVVVEG